MLKEHCSWQSSRDKPFYSFLVEIQEEELFGGSPMISFAKRMMLAGRIIIHLNSIFGKQFLSETIR